MNEKFKALGLELTRKHVEKGLLLPWGDFTNKRKACCKSCGKELLTGEGIGSYFYGMKVSTKHLMNCKHRTDPFGKKSCICDVRTNHVFLCESCLKVLREVSS